VTIYFAVNGSLFTFRIHLFSQFLIPMVVSFQRIQLTTITCVQVLLLPQLLDDLNRILEGRDYRMESFNPNSINSSLINFELFCLCFIVLLVCFVDLDLY
jgi:hypothetical protein